MEIVELYQPYKSLITKGFSRAKAVHTGIKKQKVNQVKKQYGKITQTHNLN